MLAEFTRDHVLGSLYGIAIGEALGLPYNGRSTSEIKMRWEDQPLRMEANPRKNIRAGDFGDGAAQALAVLDSFNSCCGFEGIDCAGQLLDWFELNPRGGYHSRDVLRDLSDDPEKWESCGRNYWIRKGGVAAGSGALARCAIAAIYYRDDLERMIETTIRLCQITHFDPRCVESALAINYALMQCLHKRYSQHLARDAALFLQATRQTPVYNNLVHRYNKAAMLEHTSYSPYSTYDLDHDAVLDALTELSGLRHEQLHNTGKCAHTIQAVFWCLTNGDSFEETVSKAVRLGGEAPAQGAIAGALAGARWGFSQIPNKWTLQVRDSRHIANSGDILIGRSKDSEVREIREGRREPEQPIPRVI